MTDILVSGICGKMGQFLISCADGSPDVRITAGFDVCDTEISGIPVYSNLDNVREKPDVIIDFSRPSTLEKISAYASENSVPVVFATTGYSDDQKKIISELSAKVPVFFSANMSLGISLMKTLIKKAAEVLGDDFDIEIIEKHHNMKADAPSGTALALADAVNEAFGGNKQYMYGRTPQSTKREKEIGIHAVRGGSVVGEHEVGFYGSDEIITVSHSAGSRKIFAVGAIKAAAFIKGKPSGMYGMENMI